MSQSRKDVTPKSLTNEQIAKVLLAHHSFVFRQARRFVLFTDLAEDVVQQVFVEVLDKPEQWIPKKDLRPFLFVVTRRVAQKMWRKQAKLLPESLKEIVELMQQHQPDREEVSRHDERLDTLRTCIQALPSTGRKLITDYYFEGIPTEAIAERLQKKVNTVAQAICRLREKLRNCINKKQQNTY